VAVRAISLWQPWASAVVLGSKTIETRHWSTPYRGPLVIHAAKRKVISELREYDFDNAMLGALSSEDADFRVYGCSLADRLPFGAIVGTVDVVNCLPVEKISSFVLFDPSGDDPFQWCERDLGNFGAGRFGWILRNPRRFKTPIPYRGRQSFFDVPDSILEGQ
jgi:hypothetical protein